MSITKTWDDTDKTVLQSLIDNLKAQTRIIRRIETESIINNQYQSIITDEEVTERDIQKR